METVQSNCSQVKIALIAGNYLSGQKVLTHSSDPSPAAFNWTVYKLDPLNDMRANTFRCIDLTLLLWLLLF